MTMTKTTVTMQFGDGSHKLIDVTATDPDEACEEARTWVGDNAWFEVTDPETGERVSDEHPMREY